MSIKDKLDEEQEQVEGWRPTEGQELIGTLVRVNERTTENGSYKVYTVQEPDGERLALHAFHKVLKDRLEEDPPRLGDEIAVRYLGLKQGESFSYHNYRVVVEHSARSVEEDESIAATQRANVQEQAAKDESIPF